MVRVCDGRDLPRADKTKTYLLRSIGETGHEIWDVTSPAAPARLVVVETGRNGTHKTLRVCAVAGLAVLLLARPHGQTAATSDRPSGILVIEGGTAIDGRGASPVADALIVIEGNRIRTVARKGEAVYPPGARVLRPDGKFIVPGLMDAHVHYGEWLPELYLARGVTSVFEIGGGGEWALAQREAIGRGKIVSPRLFLAVGSLAGARIAALGGVIAAEGMLRSRYVVDDAAAARAVVKRYVAAGADMIKVHRGPPVEVYEAAAAEAHAAGLPVVAQGRGLRKVREAIRRRPGRRATLSSVRPTRHENRRACEFSPLFQSGTGALSQLRALYQRRAGAVDDPAGAPARGSPWRWRMPWSDQ